MIGDKSLVVLLQMSLGWMGDFVHLLLVELANRSRKILCCGV
jgi:hypothetical protein